MVNKVAISEMRIKGFGALAMQELKEMINGWPVGSSHEICTGQNLDGTRIAEEHKKISATHIEVRNYVY